MSLYEVEVYGETLCPNGSYGLYCNKKCMCKEIDCSAWSLMTDYSFSPSRDIFKECELSSPAVGNHLFVS